MLNTYILYVGAFIACTLLAYLSQKYNSKTLAQIIVLLLVCITGFRGSEVGRDTVSYISMWENLIAGEPVYVEPGFQWLMYALQQVSSDSIILFIVCSFIIYELIICRLWSFRTMSSFPVSIAVLYMSDMHPSMNIMRQYCAVAIVFYCIQYLIDGKYFKYIIGVVIASLIHFSTIIALLYLLIYDFLRWRELTIFRKTFLLIILGISPLILGLILPILETEYGNYFETHENNIGFLTALKVIFILVSLIFSRLWEKKMTNLRSILTQKDRLLVKLSFIAYILGVVLQSLGYFFPFMDRIGMPFYIMGSIYWGILFKCTQNTSLRAMYLSALILLIGIPFALSMFGNGQGVVPYTFAWS